MINFDAREDDENLWDDDTYEIEVSRYSYNGLGARIDGKEFVKWLRIHGHEAKLGDEKSGRDRIDGVWIQNDNEARDIFEKLWTRYSAE